MKKSKASIIKNFSKGSTRYDRHSQIQKAVFDEFFLGWVLKKSKKLQPKSILDIGCGPGRFTKKVSEYFPEASMVGVDLSEGMIKTAKKNYSDSSIRFVVGDACSFSLKQQFDLIISNATFQWVNPLGEAMENLGRHLTDQGEVFLSVFGPKTFFEYQKVLSHYFKRPIALLASTFRSKEIFQQDVLPYFDDVRLTEKSITLDYPSLSEFLKSLEYTTGCTSGQKDWSKEMLVDIEKKYIEQYQKVVVTADVFFVEACQPNRKVGFVVPLKEEPEKSISSLKTAEVSVSNSDKQLEDYVRLKHEVADEVVEACARATDHPHSFFDLDISLESYGFNSLVYAQIAGYLNESLQISISPVMFYEHNHLGSVVESLAELTFQGIKKEDPRLGTTVGRSKVTARHLENKADDGNVAIIGIAGRLPNSKDLNQFWSHLKAGKDLISEVPKQRWDWREYYGDPIKEMNKTNCKWGGFMEDVDKFDPLFFGIAPREAELRGGHA